MTLNPKIQLQIGHICDCRRGTQQLNSIPCFPMLSGLLSQMVQQSFSNPMCGHRSQPQNTTSSLTFVMPVFLGEMELRQGGKERRACVARTGRGTPGED